MVEQLTLNQLVPGSSPGPATSGKPISSTPPIALEAPIAFGHVSSMARAAVAVVAAGGPQPVEHLHRQLLVALGTGPGGLCPARPPQGRATACRRAKARSTERMDRRGTLEPVEQFEGLGLMTATALLFRTFIHDVPRKPEPWPQATVRVWGVLLRQSPYSTVTDLARLRG